MMRGNCSQFASEVRRLRLAAVGAGLLGSVVTTGVAPPAQALPSFARQTGQPCGTCHTDYPALTPYGRRFKLLGYTTGGGKFRTTPFPTSTYVPGLAEGYAKEFSELAAYANGISEEKRWVPPVSMMGIIGLTHTD